MTVAVLVDGGGIELESLDSVFISILGSSDLKLVQSDNPSVRVLELWADAVDAAVLDIDIFANYVASELSKYEAEAGYLPTKVYASFAIFIAMVYKVLGKPIMGLPTAVKVAYNELPDSVSQTSLQNAVLLLSESWEEAGR